MILLRTNNPEHNRDIGSFEKFAKIVLNYLATIFAMAPAI